MAWSLKWYGGLQQNLSRDDVLYMSQVCMEVEVVLVNVLSRFSYRIFLCWLIVEVHVEHMTLLLY